MLTYVTYDEFLSGGGITSGATQESIERLLGLSSMTADNLCFGRIEEQLGSLTDKQLQLIQLAVIYNTNSLLAQGEGVYTGAELGTAAIASYSAMNVSTTFKETASDDMATLTSLSKVAKQFLVQTGLCYRGLR